MDYKTAKFKIKGVEHEMKEVNSFEDEALISTFKNPKGIVNEPELWAARIARSLVKPPMSAGEVKLLPASYYNTLKAKWFSLNDPLEEAFLEENTINTTTGSISASESSDSRKTT